MKSLRDKFRDIIAIKHHEQVFPYTLHLTKKIIIDQKVIIFPGLGILSPNEMEISEISFLFNQIDTSFVTRDLSIEVFTNHSKKYYLEKSAERDFAVIAGCYYYKLLFWGYPEPVYIDEFVLGYFLQRNNIILQLINSDDAYKKLHRVLILNKDNGKKLAIVRGFQIGVNTTSYVGRTIRGQIVYQSKEGTKFLS